jgi:hypothetical protein
MFLSGPAPGALSRGSRSHPRPVVPAVSGPLPSAASGAAAHRQLKSLAARPHAQHCRAPSAVFPRVPWAELFRRTFAVDVLTCHAAEPPAASSPSSPTARPSGASSATSGSTPTSHPRRHRPLPRARSAWSCRTSPDAQAAASAAQRLACRIRPRSAGAGASCLCAIACTVSTIAAFAGVRTPCLRPTVLHGLNDPNEQAIRFIANHLLKRKAS